MFESGAILQYVADKYGGLDTPEKRAAVGKWIMWANASLDPICFKENERGQVIGTKLTESPRAILILEALLGEPVRSLRHVHGDRVVHRPCPDGSDDCGGGDRCALVLLDER